METKTKCLTCGYSLFFNKKVSGTIECPKCKSVWKVVEENEDVFLEPSEELASEPV